MQVKWNKRKSLKQRAFYTKIHPHVKGSKPYFGAYLGSDSTGFEIKNPLNPAAFSPCLPNPVLLIRPIEGLSVPPVYDFDMKVGGRTSTPATWVGKALLACSRQEVKERLDLADWRNISPRRTLTHPSEKRKKAETRVKVSTWCERIAAPILDGIKQLERERKVINKKILTAFE